jgi:hypothetical protein
MNARADIREKWDQLLAALGEAAQLHLVSEDDGRSAAIIQLAAVLDFFRGTAAEHLSLLAPLHILLSALRDLQEGTAKPLKIFEPKRTKGGRPGDDLALRSIKVVTAVIMDQLCENLSREKAAEEVVKVFSRYKLSNFRGRDISATAVTKWRERAKEGKDPELTHQFNRLLSMDTEILGQDASLERKRDLLLKVRLPQLLIEFGARGPKAEKTRQQLISELDRQIPKNPT